MTPYVFQRAIFLTGASIFAIQSLPAIAQDEGGQAVPASQASGETSADQDGASGNSIIVQGQRLRGQLDVEQAPLLEFNEQDIAAEGVTSVADLITQISQQSGSSRGRGGGGRPIILVNGLRIGSFREIRSYPPEALARVEVFPEEVAQRFGYPPDRRVMNLILKENYRNAEVEFEFEGPSSGGYHQREQELGFLQIAGGGRINLNLELSDVSLLSEDERDIIQTPGSISDLASDPDQAPFRSLVADSRGIEASLSWARAFLESGISVSANANYERSDSRSLQGLNTVQLTDGAGTSLLRTFGEDTPLEQRISSDTFSLSGSLTKPISAFRLTSTFDAALVESEREIERRFDTSGLEADALAGMLALDGALPSDADAGFDTALSRTWSASTLHTLRGPLADLPAGELSATFDVGYDWVNLQTSDTRGSLPVDLTRGDLSTGMNLVIPITSRRNGFADALGSITLNGQIGLQHLSDFGTLGDYTVGLNWAPFDNLELSANYIEREVAPSLSALGAPQVVTENVPVFDFINGETVLASVTTGGNPALLAETQSDWKFATNWELPFWDGARFGAEYIRNRSDNVTSGFPALTQEIEAAFPGRVTRDGNGTLIALDNRSVTFAETRAERLNFSLNFRGRIGGGEEGEGRGGREGSGQRQRPSSPATPATSAVGANGPQAEGQGSGQGGGRRAAFMQFRSRICADDGLHFLTRLIEAAQNGEDPSTIMPGMSERRMERLLSRVRDENGQIDPARISQLRERMCAAGAGSGNRGGSGGAPDGPSGPGGPGGETFAAFRNIACGEDGEARIRALVARIEAGEDVSDELPGYDPNAAGFILDRLRGPDGAISSERIAGMRSRFCENGGGQNGQTAQGGAGGSPPGFNPLARRNFSGFRYFVSLNHQIELENSILIAPGLAPFDQLDGQATSNFGLPRHSTRLEAGIFGQGVGMRISARYTGKTRLDGSAQTGSSAIFFNDLATFNLRVFTDLGRLLGQEEGPLRNLGISLRADNIFDAQRRIIDQNGVTPLNYQPDLIDPTGRFIGIDIRKLF